MAARSRQTSGLLTDLNRAVLALADALDFVGVDEIGHGHRVALMAWECAEALGWTAKARRDMVVAGLLHDCGVSSTREHRILVSALAWEGEQAHCDRGAAYLSQIPHLAHLAAMVRDHHTPWAALSMRDMDPALRLATNLLHLTDRADALRARGVGEGAPIIDMLEQHQEEHFAPVLMAAFRDRAQREAFWFAQEEPALRERLVEILPPGRGHCLDLAEVKALAALFGRMIDAKSPYTERHSQGVARVARRLGECFHLPAEHLDMIEVAALLHDVGKLRIPDELLERRGPLSMEERRRMARHAFDTFEVLRRVFGDGPVARWASYHHEHVSGNGYPFHRDDGDLPLEARIIAVADVVQALAQNRPYRPSLTPPEIAALLDGMVFGGKLDARVVERVKAEMEVFWHEAIAGESGASKEAMDARA